MPQFEFVGRTPTAEEVTELLDGLDHVWGVPFAEIVDFVQGLPSTKKVKRLDEKGRKVDEYVDVITLYVSVAGRVQQCRMAAEANGWRVDYEPEPVTPTGCPGFLQMDDRLVYREYVTIWQLRDPDGQMLDSPVLLGRKSGQAWVPATGGRQAAGSNPYEKVETSARGRALGAWGFGVLPGSGIASLEEMQQAQSRGREPVAGGEEESARKSPEERMEDLKVLIEKVRQARNKSVEQMFTEIAQYASKSFGVDVVLSRTDDGAVDEIDLNQLKPGQVMLLGSALQQTLRQIAQDEPL